LKKKCIFYHLHTCDICKHDTAHNILFFMKHKAGRDLVVVFLRQNKQFVTFLNLFISITLYMFRLDPPPIIRSSDCTYNFWYVSNLAATCCDHGSIPTMIATGSSKF
jgi:hypothetical protein